MFNLSRKYNKSNYKYIFTYTYIYIYNLQIYGFKVDKARIDRTKKSREINNYNGRI